MRRVSDKLHGKDFYSSATGDPTEPAPADCETLDVPDQVQRLIEQATDVINLSQAYVGWCRYGDRLCARSEGVGSLTRAVGAAAAAGLGGVRGLALVARGSSEPCTEGEVRGRARRCARAQFSDLAPPNSPASGKMAERLVYCVEYSSLHVGAII